MWRSPKNFAIERTHKSVAYWNMWIFKSAGLISFISMNSTQDCTSVGCIKTFSLLGQAWIKKRMTDNQHAVLENLHNNTMSHNSVVFYGEPMQYSLDPEDRCRTSCQAVYYLTHSSTSLSNPWLDRASSSGWRYQQKLSVPYLASAVTPVSPIQPDSLGQKVTVWT